MCKKSNNASGKNSVRLQLTINGQLEQINAIRIFYARNPYTREYHVNFIADSGKQVRLFCQDVNEAKTLTQNIYNGAITDLTNYKAEWNI